MFISDEINYWDALGLEEPTSEQTPETADPEEQPTGANEPDPARLDDEEKDPEETEPEETEPEPEQSTEPKPEQSKSERAKQAAARRQREQDAAIQAAVNAALARQKEENDRKIKTLLEGLNLKDPDNGNASIDTLEAYQDFHRRQAAKKAELDLKRGKLTPETLQNLVAQMPEIQQARQVIQQAEQEKAAAQQQQQQARINAEIAEINKIDPTISTLQDLMAAESGQEVYKYVKTGLNLVEAYKLANIDKLTGKAAAAAKAQRQNSEQSKAHLQSTSSRGAGAQEVPRDVMEMYRLVTPDMTDAEIRKNYNRYLKSIRK